MIFFVNINIEAEPNSSINDNNYISNQPKREEDDFNFTPVNDELVYKIINSLQISKACGLDGIGAKPLKMSIQSIVPFITKFINQSFSQGIYPDEWKCAKVLPVHKKGDTSDLNNYRPISILPTISKVVEKIAHQQLYKYLTERFILNKAQFGFRPGHSTTAALASMTDTWFEAIDNGQLVCAIFLDLRRAFDSVNIGILLTKLQNMGCSDKTLEWFNSYLNLRSQHVKYKQSISGGKTISIGVPQGSILGPLLFLILINDLPNVIKSGQITMYADDTTLFICGTNLQDMKEKIQEDINAVNTWLKLNK